MYPRIRSFPRFESGSSSHAEAPTTSQADLPPPLRQEAECTVLLFLTAGIPGRPKYSIVRYSSRFSDLEDFMTEFTQ